MIARRNTQGISLLLAIAFLLVACDKRPATAEEVIDAVRPVETTRERAATAAYPFSFSYPANWKLDEGDANRSGPHGTGALVVHGLDASDIRINVFSDKSTLDALVAERVGTLQKISPRGYARIKDVTEIGGLQGHGQVYRVPVGRLFYRMTYFISDPNERVPVSLWIQVMRPESDESGNAAAVDAVLASLKMDSASSR